GAKRFFASGASLLIGDVTVFVDDDVDGIDGGLVHGGKIGVFHEDDPARTRVLLEIFLNDLLGFADVDRQNNQAFVAVLFVEFVYVIGFGDAEFAPGRPEFEEDDFAFDAGIVEFFAGSSDRVEARSRLVRARSGAQQNSGKKEGGCETSASVRLGDHAGN